MKSLQKKGILTVILIILGESVTLTNAVQFWNTYQDWSNIYGRNRFANQQNRGGNNGNGGSPGECVTDVQTSLTSTTTSSPVTSKLHPRQLARAAASIGKRTCSTAMYDCCSKACPSCLDLDIRGGHLSAESIVADTILSSASSSTAAAVVGTPYNIPLNLWKVIFQIFLTALNVACWLIPLRSKRIVENKLALGLANAFSGGVFLTLAFGHLIPECVHGFEGMNEALPYMIVLGGYLLIFFVEKVAFDAHLPEVEQGDGDGDGDSKVVTQNGDEKEEGSNVGRSAVILLGALAVHSILEMTALGLSRSFGDSALLTLSIALHQVSTMVDDDNDNDDKNDDIEFGFKSSPKTCS